MKTVDEFIEKYYPNYSSCSDIARENDLYLIMEEEEEDGSIADELLRGEYDWNRQHAKLDWIQLRMEILEAAIEGYLAKLNQNQ